MYVHLWLLVNCSDICQVSVRECAAAPDNVDKTPQIVAKVYKVFISVLSFIVAVGFIIYGLRLIALLGAMNHDVRASLVKVANQTSSTTDLFRSSLS